MYEPSGTWRALARVGYALHVTRAWGHNLPAAGVYVTFITRVLEKGALLTALLLREALKLLAGRRTLGGVTTVWFMSDPGPHYRSSTTVCALALPLLQYLRAANGSSEGPGDFGRAKTAQAIGENHHSKNDEDAFLSELDGRMKEYEKGHDIMDTADVVRCMEEGAPASPRARRRRSSWTGCPRFPGRIGRRRCRRSSAPRSPAP